MNKLLVSLILLFSLSVHSEIEPSASVKEAQLAAETKCVKGCLVLSPEEVAAIEKGINAAVLKAYEAGLRGWSKVS